MTKHEQYKMNVSYNQNGAYAHSQQPHKFHNPVFGPAFFAVIVLAVMVVAALVSGFVTIFEDGSFAIGFNFPWLFTGCLPGCLCSL
jgi:hypothetical protein